jgi:hypothetical protein
VGTLGAFVPPKSELPHALIEPSACGVEHILEVQTHPMTKAIPRFIQMQLPLPPLKLMVQSQPSILRAAKALVVE